MEEFDALVNDALLVKIHEIIDNKPQNKEGLTTTDILKTLDQQLKLSKEEYRQYDNRIRYRINKTQQLLIEKFQEFKQTKEYEKLLKNFKALGASGQQISNNDYYGIINSGAYTEDELDEILIEQIIFDKFILNLEEKYGVNLLLPGSKNYWIRPRLVDIDQYGYQLFKRHVKGLNTIGARVYENGKFLIEKPDKPQLKYHTESLLGLITPHKKEEKKQ